MTDVTNSPPVNRPQIGDSLPGSWVPNPPRQHRQVSMVAVVDGPNIDTGLYGLYGRQLKRAERPNFAQLLKFLRENTALRHSVDESEVEVHPCVFTNYRDDNMQDVEGFVNFLVRQANWEVIAKYKGPVNDPSKKPGADNIDIDEELLDYLRVHTPTDGSYCDFYVLTNDTANVGAYLRELAGKGHQVHLICLPEFANPGKLRRAGIEVTSLRDVPGLFDIVPPKQIDLSDVAVGEIKHFKPSLPVTHIPQS